jgi:hypothetical protein
MSNSYIGVRAEVVSRIVKTDLCKIVEQYNTKNESQLFDLYVNGKITVERINSMIIARGEEDKRKKKSSGTVNFSIMLPIDKKEVDRIVQIINVLGNGRLIRERVNTFVSGNSTLNKLPELGGLVKALNTVDSFIPGFIKGGWYYAPEANF